MKKIKFLLIALCIILTASFVSCDVIDDYVDTESIIGEIIGGVIEDSLNDNCYDHTCEFVEWEVITDPTCSEEGEEVSYCEICFEESTRPVAKLDHTPEDVEALAPTCTEPGYEAGVICSECGEAISGAAPIAATGHNEVIIPAVDATEDSFAKTEGKKCIVCGIITVKPETIYPEGFNVYSDPNKYDGDYAYNSLAKLENGAAMQSFYMEIDTVADAFHTSDSDALYNEVNNYHYAAQVIFSDNGITAEQALSAWNAYTIDHPLYYWMSKQIRYSEGGGYINIIVDEDYVSAETRQGYNTQIYATVKEYVESLDGEDEIYEITYAFNNLISLNADYAYIPGTEIPSDEDWAHNIIGVMLGGEGVCESYAKSFQLLLNYCGVECIFITGQANGGAHAWNMVKLDSGEWYLYDLTWCDSLANLDYFCKNEMGDHYADAPGGTGINYTYDLPETADAPYSK